MKNKILVIIVIAVFATLGLGLLKSDNYKNISPLTENVVSIENDMSDTIENLEEVIADVIERQFSSKLVLLDVRTDQEWEVEHAKGAVLWGLAEHLSKGEMPDIDKDAEIFIYCRTGNRAEQAIKAMQAAGFTNLTNIKGLSDWKAAGGETEIGK